MEPMIGMIGCGNMGRAIVEGILKAKVAKENQIYAANRHLEKLSDLAERGIKTVSYTHLPCRMMSYWKASCRSAGSASLIPN